ncbi:hypothetical protein F5878DRAFT_702344 [Lentinula raphanica]|uniref:Uncharacterized protein n=1 Tax=Lentinula raphanica TaxID=153919 RepID=A0AA38PFX4_9AGAR|nr:hypothetical protein F5878DRAFT_702344 [Lentinula raphanica]
MPAAKKSSVFLPSNPSLPLTIFPCSTRAPRARKGSSKRLQKKSAPLVADSPDLPSSPVQATTARFIDDEASVSMLPGTNVSSDEDFGNNLEGDNNEYEVGSFVVADDVSMLSSLSSPEADSELIPAPPLPLKDGDVGDDLLNFESTSSNAATSADISQPTHEPGAPPGDDIKIEWSVTPSPRTKLRNRIANHKFQPRVQPFPIGQRSPSPVGQRSPSPVGQRSPSPNLVISSPVLLSSPLPKPQTPSARALGKTPLRVRSPSTLLDKTCESLIPSIFCSFMSSSYFSPYSLLNLLLLPY